MKLYVFFAILAVGPLVMWLVHYLTTAEVELAIIIGTVITIVLSAMFYKKLTK